MYPASNAFHAAVANGNKQIALLIFQDAFFSNEDIDIEKGIEFNDYFNTQEDLAIGQALSNEISFTIFNDNRDLNNYAFGDFIATLGVQLTTAPYTETANCSAAIGRDTYTGYSTSPYIRKNGSALNGQPNFAVRNILVYDNAVYAFGSNGRCKKWVDGTPTEFTLNAFMTRKTAKWSGKGYSFNSQTRIMTERDGTNEKLYEFVPLGTFIADRPNVPDVLMIDFNCNDLMMKLDKDMPTKSQLGVSYPTTIGALFTKVCQYFHVPYETNTFINSGAAIAKEPEEFKNATARTVIGWIAEAAASNARFSRDGKLVMDWVRNSGMVLDEANYSEFRPYWYETTTVNRIKNRDTQGSAEKEYGSGQNIYLIQDNPLLKGFT